MKTDKKVVVDVGRGKEMEGGKDEGEKGRREEQIKK